MYQESARHAETLDAITRYLDMGTYSEWDEEKKLEFLARELKGKRPLVPPSIEVWFLDSTSLITGFAKENLYGMKNKKKSGSSRLKKEKQKRYCISYCLKLISFHCSILF